MPNIEVKLRRGTDTEHSSFTGAEGEVTVDTTNDTLRVHDGSTAGGVRLAKLSEVSGGTGTVTEVDAGTGLETNPVNGIVGTGTIGIANGGVGTNQLANDAVTFAKMQNINTAKVIGRTTASSGDPEEVSILDDDTMATASATSLATSESIKAYVDSNASSLSVSNWTEGTITSGTELQAPNNDKSFAGIYVRSNQCNWNETASVNYYTNATTTAETFYLQGAGDGGGTVRTSSLLLVPLYTNSSGNKVVKLSWSNMSIISGRYWI
jgi:hypothetical protein